MVGGLSFRRGFLVWGSGGSGGIKRQVLREFSAKKNRGCAGTYLVEALCRDGIVADLVRVELERHLKSEIQRQNQRSISSGCGCVFGPAIAFSLGSGLPGKTILEIIRSSRISFHPQSGPPKLFFFLKVRVEINTAMYVVDQC